MAKRIHVAGNTVLDLLVRGFASAGEGQVATWQRGRVQFLDQPIEPALGGTAATAYLLGRLGSQVSLNTNLGNDDFGAVVEGWLAHAQVRLTSPRAANTAANVILVGADGTPHWHYYVGEKVSWRQSLEESDAAWFFASGFGRATPQDLHELSDVFRECQMRGTLVAFDPGPWLFERCSREQMLHAWRHVDCLIGTESELSTWHKCDSPTNLVAELLTCGPKTVVAKRGEQGAAFAALGGQADIVPTKPVEHANTVGAGDTFNAALLHGLNGGIPVPEAVELAVQYASAAVRRGKGVLGALE